jgi:hypothetical protein
VRVIEERITGEIPCICTDELWEGFAIGEDFVPFGDVGIGVITILKALKLSIRHRSQQKTRI